MVIEMGLVCALVLIFRSEDYIIWIIRQLGLFVIHFGLLMGGRLLLLM